MTEPGEFNNTYSLKELLVNAVRSPTLTLPVYPEVIELGTIGPECDNLMRLTWDDPTRQEKGTALFLLPDGRMVIKTKVETSSLTETGMTLSIPTDIKIIDPFLPKAGRQDKLAAGIIHTHGLIDSVQSPADLLPLFIDTEYPQAVPMSGVITPRRRIFVFRGENTPTWDISFAKWKISTWEEAALQRIGENINPSMSWQYNLNINNRAIRAMLIQVAHKYDLHIYSCFHDQTILRRGLC